MSKGSYVFSQVPVADIPRSAFNRSHGHKTTFDAGYLVPVFVDEALPGDTFNVRMSAFARLSTPIVPIMDNMYMDVFFFAVPNRLLWTNWQKFMGEQTNPGDSTDYLVPQVTAVANGGWDLLSLGDYMGLPVRKSGPLANALPFRAYNLIYNEWFRDENLINSAAKNVGNGPDTYADYPVRRRGKRHDYFTSCLPWPQKGAAASIPLGTTAPVLADGVLKLQGDNGSIGAGTIQANSSDMYNARARVAFSGSGYTNPTDLTYNSGLKVDLSTATAATINSLRQAFQIQKLMERDARGGTRYTEILRSHFGVVSPDARLQRPEYLGGGTIPVNINPVTQTSSTDATTPQGHLAAYGVAGGSGIGFSKSFVEHCTIIGLVEVRADLTYQQGVNRMWSRRTKYDFYWPAFAHLGEQSVLNKEIYYQDNASDDAVFGYQERWAEYRYFPSKITGKFRSGVTGSLDVWHLSQNFTGLPTLGQTFIEDTPPVARVVAVNTEPQFLFDSHFSIKCVRPMPTYSVPGYIDHF